MNIPPLGEVKPHDEFDWYVSQPIPVPILGGERCEFTVEGYDNDPAKEDFHTAIANFLSAKKSVLTRIEPQLFQYYKDCNADWEPDGPGYLEIASPRELWNHVRLGNCPMVSRREHGDRGIYIYVTCGCDWEEEHGLELVFKNGLEITKLGQYDDHATNSDAYAEPSFEERIYIPRTEIMDLARKRQSISAKGAPQPEPRPEQSAGLGSDPHF